MRLKKYRVATLADAMRLIRKDLGPDAVILHTRDLSSVGLLGLFRRPMIEVVAAVDETDNVGRRPEPTDDAVGSPSGQPSVMSESAAPAGVLASSDPPSPFSPHQGNSASEMTPGDAPSGPQPTPSSTSDAQILARISEDLADLRATVARLVAASQPTTQSEPSDVVLRCHAALIEQGLSPGLTAEVVAEVRRDLSAEALADVAAVRDAAASRLARRLTTTGSLRPYPGSTRAVFLIGPTGVGKTTTLAKLAANLAIQQYRVSLVTADTFRIAAIPQLQTYADILGLEMEVAYTPRDLEQVLSRQRESSLVLVDTPGRSQYRDAQIDELAEFVAAAPKRTVYLTLSAATRPDELTEIAERFGRIPLDGLLFTKLDETRHYGGIATLASDLGKPLSYFATGQNVPSDIEIADAGHLAARVVGGLDD